MSLNPIKVILNFLIENDFLTIKAKNFLGRP
jgi:hypothetical protein